MARVRPGRTALAVLALVLATALPWRAWAIEAHPAGAQAATTPEPMQAADAPGCADPPALPRFEGARILGCQSDENDETTLPLAPWNPDPDVSFWDSSVRLEGRRTRLLYAIPPGRSTQEVMRSYRKALTDLGYEILFECGGFAACGAGVDAVYSDDTYGKRLPTGAAASAFAQDTIREPRILVARGSAGDAKVHVFLFAAHQDNPADAAAGRRVALFQETVTGQGPEEHLILLSADELAQGIALDGHVPIYGIYFEPQGAEIKPESHNQIEQIAKLLKDRPRLALHIVVHTDNQGDFAQNLELSRQRAQAVAAVLSRDFGIPAARLSPQGVASLAPVAPNTADEGRTMNRRIELVPQ